KRWRGKPRSIETFRCGGIMSKKLLSKSVGTLLISFFIAITALSVRGEDPIAQDSAVKDVTFSLTRLPENPKQYSLVLSDPDERSISGVFSIGQLQILQALMAEAEKFALSEES